MPSYRRSRCSDPRQRAARRVAPIVSIPVGCELAAPVPLQKLFPIAQARFACRG